MSALLPPAPRTLPAPVAGGLAAILLAALCGSARAADLQLSEQGLGITVTGMAHMEVPWPMLMPGEKKPIESHVGAHGAELKYAQRRRGQHQPPPPAGRWEYRWRHMPKEVVSFHLTTWVGADIGDGGNLEDRQRRAHRLPQGQAGEALPLPGP